MRICGSTPSPIHRSIHPAWWLGTFHLVVLSQRADVDGLARKAGDPDNMTAEVASRLRQHRKREFTSALADLVEGVERWAHDHMHSDCGSEEAMLEGVVAPLMERHTVLQDLCAVTGGAGHATPDARRRCVMLLAAMYRAGHRNSLGNWVDFLTDVCVSEGMPGTTQRRLVDLGLAEHADTWKRMALAVASSSSSVLGVPHTSVMSADNSQKLLRLKLASRLLHGGTSRMQRNTSAVTLTVPAGPDATGLGTAQGMADTAFLRGGNGEGRAPDSVHPIDSFYLPSSAREVALMVDASCPLSPIDASWSGMDPGCTPAFRPATETETLDMMEAYATGETMRRLKAVIGRFVDRAEEEKNGVVGGPAALLSAPWPSTPEVLVSLSALFDRISTVVRDGADCLRNIAKLVSPVDPRSVRVKAGTVVDANPDTRQGLLQFLSQLGRAQADADAGSLANSIRQAQVDADGAAGRVPVGPDRSVRLMSMGDEAAAMAANSTSAPERPPDVAGYHQRRAASLCRQASEADRERQEAEITVGELLTEGAAWNEALHGASGDEPPTSTAADEEASQLLLEGFLMNEGLHREAAPATAGRPPALGAHEPNVAR